MMLANNVASGNGIKTQRREYEGHNTPLVCYTDHGQRAAVSMIAKGSILERVLPLMHFLRLLPNYIHVYMLS